MKRLFFIIALFILFIFGFAENENKIFIKSVNESVKSIKNKIKQFNYITIDGYCAEEVCTPEIIFYYENEILTAAKIIANHETWVKEFWYFFNNKGEILKYSEEIKNRDDNPPKEAIIYNPDGSIAWQNMKEPQIEPNYLNEFFKSLYRIEHQFSQY